MLCPWRTIITRVFRGLSSQLFNRSEILPCWVCLRSVEDYWGLGGVDFIGKPKQPTLTVGWLEDEGYLRQLYRLGQPIQSRVFPELRLTLDTLMG